MKFIAALIAVAAFSCAASAQETNKEKIVGVWKVTAGDKVPPSLRIEFTKDGKVVVHLEVDGKAVSQPVGTYKIEGDKVTLIAVKDGKEDIEVDEIKLLSAEKMILVDPKKKEITMERVKPIKNKD